MSDSNPATGQPYGGRDQRSDADSLPGEKPLSGEENRVAPPHTSDEDETGSRAATGPMDSTGTDSLQPTPGVPEQLHAQNSGDTTEADPPGGSVANQPGRAPDQ